MIACDRIFKSPPDGCTSFRQGRTIVERVQARVLQSHTR